MYDGRDIAKQLHAKNLARVVTENDSGVISMQVVQEFCSVALHKLKLFDQNGLQKIIDNVLAPIVKHYPNEASISRAIKLYAKNSLSFYDALIIQAAIDTDCDVLYSEDLHDGQVFGKLKIVNPFKKI